MLLRADLCLPYEEEYTVRRINRKVDKYLARFGTKL
jgi:hypothetical protein